MAREDPQMKLRLPLVLKTRIEALAKANGRSLNAEIVQRLEVSLAIQYSAPGVFLAHGPADHLMVNTGLRDATSEQMTQRLDEVIASLVNMRHAFDEPLAAPAAPED